MAQQQDTLFYCILDCGDGSARAEFFKTQEALDLYLAIIEEERDTYDLSEGGSRFNPDEAMDVDAVNAEFNR